jgi:hypothetical protein
MQAQKAKEENHFSHEKSFVVEITFFRPIFCENSPKKTQMLGIG